MRHIEIPAFLTLLALAVPVKVPLLAQEAKPRGDAAALLEKISKILSQDEERIASLERVLKDKDKEIADLKKKVEELAQGKKPEEKPAEKQRQALLGVAHEDPGDEARSK